MELSIVWPPTWAQLEPSFPPLATSSNSCQVVLLLLCDHAVVFRRDRMVSCELARLGGTVWPPADASFGIVTWLELAWVGVPFGKGFWSDYGAILNVKNVFVLYCTGLKSVSRRLCTKDWRIQIQVKVSSWYEVSVGNLGTPVQKTDALEQARFSWCICHWTVVTLVKIRWNAPLCAARTHVAHSSFRSTAHRPQILVPSPPPPPPPPPLNSVLVLERFSGRGSFWQAVPTDLTRIESRAMGWNRLTMFPYLSSDQFTALWRYIWKCL